jgi:hypothetical protein
VNGERPVIRTHTVWLHEPDSMRTLVQTDTERARSRTFTESSRRRRTDRRRVTAEANGNAASTRTSVAPGASAWMRTVDDASTSSG